MKALPRILAAAWLLATWSAVPAAATPSLSPPPGAQLPLDAAARTEDGRATTLGTELGGTPAVLVFADFTCITLCGTALGLAAAALPETGLRAGRDYRLLVLGLDPSDGPADAAAMRRSYLGEDGPLSRSARFLVAAAPTIARVEAAFGYHADRDPVAGRYDHPLALLVLRADGVLVSVLPWIACPAALRQALTDAARSASAGGSFAAGIARFCRGIGLPAPGDDPRGRAILAAYRASLLVTAALIAGALALGWRVARRRRDSGA